MAREQFQSLSEQMYYILLALWDEQCGADISRRADELSQGRIRIGPAVHAFGAFSGAGDDPGDGERRQKAVLCDHGEGKGDGVHRVYQTPDADTGRRALFGGGGRRRTGRTERTEKGIGEAGQEG